MLNRDVVMGCALFSFPPSVRAWPETASKPRAGLGRGSAKDDPSAPARWRFRRAGRRRDRPADRRLGTDMADAEAAGRTREAAVGHQRDLLASTLAIECRRRRQHLAHSRPAARPFVADDDDVAFAVLAFLDCLEGILLAVEAARRTA